MPKQFYFPDGFHEPEREHDSNCRCKTCCPELWLEPIGFNPRRATFLAILYAIAALGAASLFWAAMDANGFNPNIDANGNPIRRLDADVKTCFESRPLKFCGEQGPRP